MKELALYMKENKAYWMAPIFLVVLLLVGVVLFGGTAAAPFVYTLF